MPSTVRLPAWGRPAAAAFVVAASVLAGFAAPADAAAPPSVSVQVTGLGATRIAGPRTVSPVSFTRTVGSAPSARNCRISQSTPLAALRALGASFVVKDFGKCSLNIVDSASLFVDSIAGLAGTGMQGWSYKVNNRAGTAGAADPNGPFGSGPLRSGSRVLWFWCTYDPTTYACQGNLVVTAPTMVGRGRRFTVEVREYDDAGRSKPAVGVRVKVEGAGEATTGYTGKVVFTAPSAKGIIDIDATEGRVVAAGAGRPAAFTFKTVVF